MEDVSRITDGIRHRDVVGQSSSNYLDPASGEFRKVLQVGTFTSQDSHLFPSASENLSQPPAKKAARPSHQHWHPLSAPHFLEDVQRKLKVL